MDLELLQGLAAEVAEQMHQLQQDMQRNFTAEVAEIRRAAEAECNALRANLSEVQHALDLARAELQQLVQAGAGEAREQVQELRQEVQRDITAEVAEIRRAFEVVSVALRERQAEAQRALDLTRTELQQLVQTSVGDAREQMHTLRLDVQRNISGEVTEVRRAVEVDSAALRERQDDAQHALERTHTELQVLRTAAAEPLAAVVLDPDGVLHLVPRSGPPLSVRLPDVQQLVQAAVSQARDTLRQDLQGEISAGIARSFELHNNAPAWSSTAVYTEGQMVQAYMGRTYRVRRGKTSMGQDPGDHSETWERLGTAGLRVFKSKPSELQPGDVFTDADSRFLHDGRNVILFVPKAAKVSDIERATKGTHAAMQSAQEQVRTMGETLAVSRQQMQRNDQLIAELTEQSIQALALIAQQQAQIEALQRRLDDLDEGAA